ncbi:Transmembrane protein 246 [Merluccius polli]|uniref:Transmembrane protein 246 n=1 Tax=Merluccius polli TaxID=89951 RepID=A0AA47M4F9_MERPO|nr:Transmembrane protein 246 [Merluccius polli]
MECLRQVKSRWRVCVWSSKWRMCVWSRPAAQALVLCLLTFGVVLPVLCHQLLYSYYFFRPWYLEPRSEQVLRDSYRRGQEALRFWQEATAPTFQTHPEPHLLVTVVTARRTEGRNYHYLLQVMQQLAGLLASCRGQHCAQVLLCDVESSPQGNEDAALLEGRFQMVRRSAEEKRRRISEEVNTFEREKRDYVFCLQKGWELRPQNVVVLEDDAWPRPDFFRVIQNLLSRSFSRGSLYIKLYHPERLQSYWNPEPYRLLEWLGLGLLTSSLLLQVLPYCSSFSHTPRHLLFLSLYVMVLVELVGRHYLLELRRASPQLYAVSPATECCTPAMLFPGNSSVRAAHYLDGSFCVKGNAKDLLLFHMARSVPGERAHSLEPNLVTHIGAYSSVRPNPVKPSLL